MRHEPGIKEDAQNLSIVAGSAAVAALVTIALIAASSNATPEPITAPEVRAVVVGVEPLMEPAPPPAPAEPLSGIDRLYGTVTTVHGSKLTGYVRWDRNEGSWTDLLDAYKPHHRGGSSVSGIRFGHVDRLDVVGANAALLTLRSGDRIELTANASDLGRGLRALIVDGRDGDVAELTWADLASVDFEPAPATPPAEARIHGTVTTRSGLQLTGHVTWDVDEIYSTDILDGDADGRRMQIPFGEIASIERYSSWASRVTLTDGERYLLEGTNDVDASIRGIEISDVALGTVKLGWESFREVRFHPAAEDVSAADFDGGAPIRGTVRTVDGTEHSGEIVWDDDERYTWEMLNGDMDGLELHVEFSNIARIEKAGDPARVTLTDGRVLVMSGSNDVDHGNRGITIRTDGREFEVRWSDFAEATLTR